LSEAEPPGSPFSRRSVRLFAAAVAALLVLGALVGVLTSGGKASPKPAGSTNTTLPLGNALPSTLASLMGLTTLHDRVAPGVALFDERGNRVSLSELRGKVVLLTFLDAGCSAICPLESAELRVAERDLGAKSADVEVLAVDVDAAHRSASDAAHLARLTGLSGATMFHVLIGSLPALRATWAAYGVQVQVDEVHGSVLYEPLIVFIDPSGNERYTAVPSGFELPSGRYVVPKTQIAAFGLGIAHFAASLVGGST
jgi:cytochrome oxidase Cu insertion factor (SCO1/SenC/PrrC family)